MNEESEILSSIDNKRQRFKQQQITFISALERAREQALERTEPIRTVSQVQRFMVQHCNSVTDRKIIAFFLEIVSDLNKVLRLVRARCSSTDALTACKALLHPESDISQLRAQYPHDEILRLSCETKNYYGGVVSLIPLALDLLRLAATPEHSPAPSPITPVPAMTTTPAPIHTPTPARPLQLPCTPTPNSKRHAAVERSVQSARTTRETRLPRPFHKKVWQARRPAWKPPGKAWN
ncbi:sperm acrosome-associated protein 9 [Engraulis encrasicolus]|uniref:sperm acrosome-associated protein 9 n=1 Tax=Engraulis encrasicolus TaxID=184585 RepID=UPI002FD69E2F